MHTCPPPVEALGEWLEEYASINDNFGHLLLLQKDVDAAAVRDALRPYFESAHLDARQVFHDAIGIELHPDVEAGGTPPVEYPRCLPNTTLRGLFGEVMAGLVTESYELVGQYEWCVPIFLFRYHEDARNYLLALARDPERRRQTIGNRLMAYFSPCMRRDRNYQANCDKYPAYHVSSVLCPRPGSVDESFQERTHLAVDGLLEAMQPHCLQSVLIRGVNNHDGGCDVFYESYGGAKLSSASHAAPVVS